MIMHFLPRPTNSLFANHWLETTGLDYYRVITKHSVHTRTRAYTRTGHAALYQSVNIRLIAQIFIFSNPSYKSFHFGLWNMRRCFFELVEASFELADLVQPGWVFLLTQVSPSSCLLSSGHICFLGLYIFYLIFVAITSKLNK